MHEISIRDIYNGYNDNEEEGVVGFGGKLNIRPKYQREFIYKDKQRDDVIKTIGRGFPLNVMYWVKNQDDTFELMDGQQRTLSFCKYIHRDFSIDYKYFHNLTDSEKKQILDYKVMVYFCEGNDKEKLDWFETINIAGEKLTKQELRNAIYSGPWITDAKRYFSKTGCPAYNSANKYMDGSPIRQDYLETVIAWVSENNIEEYMATHQHKTNANDLWFYFSEVVEWVNKTFVNKRREMKGVKFGLLYNKYKDTKFDPKKIENEISKLMLDRDVTNKKGIYDYVITRNEKSLNIRAFDNNDKREAYERQEGVCLTCHDNFEIEEMEADHIVPWHDGGKTVSENCQMLCKKCNRIKSGK